MENNTNTSEDMNFSDENSCSYSKYDKDKPELKGPITSYSQYQEYVQEYRDKYDSYQSLKKILEGYSDEFKKPAVELTDAKARGDMDRFNKIWEQIMKSYRRYKPRCERMKKIFLVLQAELPSIMQRIKDFVDERKRLNEGNLIHESFSPSTDVHMFEKLRNLSPFEFAEDTYQDPNMQAGNRVDRQGSSDVGFQKGSNQALPQTGQRSFGQIPLGNPSYPLKKPDKHELSSVQKDKSHRDAQNESIHTTEKNIPRNFRDGSNGSKLSLSKDSNYQKQGEMVGKLKEDRQDTLSQLGASPKDNNRIDLDKFPGVDRRGISLQRELSDLELGLLREFTPNETRLAKQFEGKGLFKHKNTSEDMNSDITKVKPSLITTLDSGKPFSAFVSPGFPSNSESTSISESGVNQNIDLGGRSESNRRVPGHASKQDTKHGIVSHPVKESKGQTPNSCVEVDDGGKDSVFEDRDNRDQKKRESSSDESNCSYLKYDKDEPELKGPITSYPQYEEFVQELQDKFDIYLSLDKILEGYSDELKKLAVECEDAKASGDMDRYNEITEQIKETYRRCGARNEKLKKISFVLHAELWSIKQRINDFVEEYNMKDIFADEFLYTSF